MPRITRSNEQFIIYDDFLPQHAVDALLQHVNDSPFSLVNGTTWNKVWRLDDGFPVKGPAAFLRLGRRPRGDDRPHYPTGTPIDLFIEAMQEVLPDVEGLLGPSRKAWNSMSVVPYVYPAGSCLSMHHDGMRYAGSYTYFLHREWNFHWGGYLLVLDPATSLERPELYRPWLSDEVENRIVSEPGLATCILPKPNRLVFLAPDAIHMVSRVDAKAGNRPRISLTGFFSRPRTGSRRDA